MLGGGVVGGGVPGGGDEGGGGVVVPVADPAPLIGVNNRNLRTFETSLGTSLTLKDRVGAETAIVAESGIHTLEDVRKLRNAGIHTFLVGEAFMRAADPGAELHKLFGTSPHSHPHEH